jgi:hypothetical protein
MTRRDFELIAGAVFQAGAAGPVGHVAEALASALASTNPRFDRERFKQACLSGSPRGGATRGAGG